MALRLLRRMACSAMSARAASRSAGVFSARVFTPGIARLARPVRVPPGHSSISAVAPSSLEGLHAQVPADRVGDLVDQARHDLLARSRRSCRPRSRRTCTPGRRSASDLAASASAATAGAMWCGVEGAGHLERHHPAHALGLVGLQRGELLGGAGGHDLARAVHVRRGQAELLQVRQTTSSGSPPSSAAMPVARDGGGLGHGQTALAYEAQRGLVGEDAREGGGGDLADAVARDRAAGRDRRPGARGGQQAGGHQQRLGHGGVADRVGVGLRAVVDEVETDGVRPRGEPVGGTGEVEPGGQEAGRLSALAGSDEYEHSHTLSCGRPPRARGDRDEEPSGELWVSDKSLGLRDLRRPGAPGSGRSAA